MPQAIKRPKPTRDELQAAYGKTIRDVIAADLRVLFVGINPGLYSGAVGHHFARPGNGSGRPCMGAVSPIDCSRLLKRDCCSIGAAASRISSTGPPRGPTSSLKTTSPTASGASRRRSGGFDHAGSRSWESRPIKRSLIGKRRRSVRKQPNSAAPVPGSCRTPADSMRTTRSRLSSGCFATWRLPPGRRAEAQK